MHYVTKTIMYTGENLSDKTTDSPEILAVDWRQSLLHEYCYIGFVNF